MTPGGSQKQPAHQSLHRKFPKALRVCKSQDSENHRLSQGSLPGAFPTPRIGVSVSGVAAPRVAYLVQAVRAAGKCDAVFKGFSDCLLKLGDSMANYPQGLDDKTNIKTVCTKARRGEGQGNEFRSGVHVGSIR
ncbi:neuritin-like protein [Cricetulus griseus]|uniref:Neuritin-like protein n=1 Tax=Cricetulus griseus TaxID=10029 RepID=A0A061IAI7_CRIGR|nr:neuritin-like protein [Cricetulus griseus]